MRRLCLLMFVPFLVFFGGLGCTSEDKRQWHEAVREWRGENIEFGSHRRQSPLSPRLPSTIHTFAP